jgi:hypothetical protein
MKQRVFMVSCRPIFAPRGDFYQARLAFSDDGNGMVRPFSGPDNKKSWQGGDNDVARAHYGIAVLAGLRQ